MVVRSGTLRVAAPGPVNSTALPTPHRVPRRRNNSRITSLALTQGQSWPVNSIPTMAGMRTW